MNYCVIVLSVVLFIIAYYRLVSSIPDIAVFYFAKDLSLTDYKLNEKN